MTENKPKTILIVDDDPQIRKLLRIILNRDGYTVTEAPDGHAAVKAFRQMPADLVITDLIMPQKEGIETIVALRKLAPDLKIIAISGGGRLNPQTILKIAKGLGAMATMTKPIDSGELTATVSALLNDSPPDSND